jgi:malate dehydrogenase (oxaloacetate-decarboxylating)
VVLAALINGLKVADKKIEDVKIVISGAGAAGTAIAKLLVKYGADGRRMVLCDTKGVIYRGRDDLKGNRFKQELAAMTNGSKFSGSLADAMRGADVFIGVSKKGLVSRAMVRSMAPKAIVFAMANPEPEIMPDEAVAGGALVVATGRSDFPNQINNALAFPGVFRGALDARATRITEKMKVAAAEALAGMVKPSPGAILPPITERSVAKKVSDAVAKAWKST